VPVRSHERRLPGAGQKPQTALGDGSGADQHDPPLHARRRKQDEGAPAARGDVPERERAIDLAQLAAQRAQAANAQGSRERKDHAMKVVGPA